MGCKHQHGDNVAPLMGWVCGQCFTILPERPQRLGIVGIPMTAALLGEAPNGGSRQEVVWQAEILKSAEGTTLSTFIMAIAKRYIRKGGLDKASAYDMALDALKGIGDEFGDPSSDWSRVAAVDIADEEMTYWEQDCAGANG